MQRKTILAIAVISLFIGTTVIPVSAMLTKSHSETTLQTLGDSAKYHFKVARVSGQFQYINCLPGNDPDDPSCWYDVAGLWTYNSRFSMAPREHQVKPETEAEFVGIIDEINGKPVKPRKVTINVIGVCGSNGFDPNVIGWESAITI